MVIWNFNVGELFNIKINEKDGKGGEQVKNL